MKVWGEKAVQNTTSGEKTAYFCHKLYVFSKRGRKRAEYRYLQNNSQVLTWKKMLRKR